MKNLIKQARKKLKKKWKDNGYAVSKSRIGRFRRCKRQHFYAECLNLEKIKKAKPLIRGTIIHELVEYDLLKKPLSLVWKKVDKEWGKLFREEKDLYGDLPGDLKKIFKGYMLWYKNDPLKYIYVEKPFRIQFVGDILLSGVIDGIARDKSKGRWLVETKSRNNLPTERTEYSSVESALYAWAASKARLGEVKGICWNYIRAKPPTIPKVLKAGGLSKNKKIDTTWDVYRQAIKDNKLKVKDYFDMKKQLRGKENDFFDRVYIPFSKPTQRRVLEEAKLTAIEMRELDKSFVDTGNEIAYIRSIDDMKCNHCDFKGLCQAELMNLDTDFMLKKEYKDRPDGSKTIKAQKTKRLSRGRKKD